LKKTDFEEGSSKRPLRKAAAAASAKLTTETLEGMESDRGDLFGKWIVDGLGKIYHHQMVRTKKNVCNDIEVFARIVQAAFGNLIDNIDAERTRLAGVERWADDVANKVDLRVLAGGQSSASAIEEDEDEEEGDVKDADGESAN
jgi:hypothetical protein